MSLFDLEGVHPIADLPRMNALCSFFDDHDYGRFVLDRFLDLYPCRRMHLGNVSFLRARPLLYNIPLSLPRRILRALNRYSTFMRRRRLSMHHHTHLIEL
jgi:hypothetical protein